jgi:NADP-dependent 3-hydroxy acid dehydrogenase YdfG
MQQKVHEQEGRAYDAGQWIRPETVAEAILHVLDLPTDATVSDLMLRPV